MLKRPSSDNVRALQSGQDPNEARNRKRHYFSI